MNNPLTPFLPPAQPERPTILSRHPSHKQIIDKLPELPFRCVIRFGDLTPQRGRYVELNNAQACMNSADKLLMKQCFDKAGIKTAPWWTHDTIPKDLPYPIVVKHRMGSRGTGVYKIEGPRALVSFLETHNRNNYIFERFLGYPKEYRCHTWDGGIFNTCRKALMNSTPKRDRWKFNAEQTVWLRESNTAFDKPACWKAIELECIKAMRSCGLQFTGCDVKVRGDEFFIIELNSAPSFGDLTAEAYIKLLPLIATHHHYTHGHTWHFKTPNTPATCNPNSPVQ